MRLDQEARGQFETTPRFVLYNHCNGLQTFHLNKSVVSSPTDFELAAFMTNFEPFKDELTVVERMYCGTGRYLHGNGSSALACANRGQINGAAGISPRVVGGITIDQAIADHLGKDSRLRSLVLGHPLAQRGGNCVQGTIAGRANNEPVFPTLDPLQAHELVFGVGGQDEVLSELEQSYLDFVKDDIQVYSATLPGTERQKLDQYLESVREVERAIISGEATNCEPLPTEEFPDAVEGTEHNNPAFWRYMIDLGVAALQCGATQQLTMLHSYGCVHLRYTFDGVTKNHHEQVSHEEENGPFMANILNFHAENVAYLYGRLKDIPEGNGSMADSTLLAWMSDGGGKHHDGAESHNMIYLGNGNGRLRSGQWLKLEQDAVPLGRAHLTAAHATGLELETFGDGTDPIESPIQELLS